MRTGGRYEWKCNGTSWTTQTFVTKVGRRPSPICEKSAAGSRTGKKCMPRDMPWPRDKWSSPGDWKVVSEEIKQVENCIAKDGCKKVTTWSEEAEEELTKSTELGAAANTDAQDMALSSEEINDLHSPEFKNALGSALQMLGSGTLEDTLKLNFEDANKLGEGVGLWRRRRRGVGFFKAVGRHIKKAAQTVHKHVKKGVKFAVKHVKKGLKAVGKWISSAAMKLFNKALNAILSLIPQPWRNILKKGLPKIFKKDFKGFLLIHEVKEMIAKIVKGFVPKTWKPFIKGIIVKGFPKIFGGKVAEIILIRETGQLLAVIIEGFVPNVAPYIGFKSRKILEKVLVKGPKYILQGNLTAFTMVPEVRVLGFMTTKLLAMKLDSGAAGADNWAQAMYRWIPMLLNRASMTRRLNTLTGGGPIQVAYELKDRVKTLLLEPLFTARLRVNMMWFECQLRNFMMPLFNRDYTVSLLPINFSSKDVHGKIKRGAVEGTQNAIKLCSGEDCDGEWATSTRTHSNQTPKKYGRTPQTDQQTYKPVTLSTICKGNQKRFEAHKADRKRFCAQRADACQKNRDYKGSNVGPGQGPQRIVIVRQLKTTWRGGSKNGGWNTLDVCHFSFGFHAYKCDSASKYCGANGGKRKRWYENIKILDNANYDPSTQVAGHNCRKWFVMAQRLINSIIMAQLTFVLVGQNHNGGVKDCADYHDAGYWGPGYDKPKVGCAKALKEKHAKEKKAKVLKEKDAKEKKAKVLKEKQTKERHTKERQHKDKQKKEKQTKEKQAKEKQAKEKKQKHRHHRHHRHHRRRRRRHRRRRWRI